MIARVDHDDTLPLDQVVHGECLSVMRSFPDNSVDSIVCDPPAGIAFMSKKWDDPNYFPLNARSGKRQDGGGSFGKGLRFNEMGKRERDTFIAWLAEVMIEALRCLKPGGHALVWSLPRTSHWTGLALEQAGFEMRDCLYHTQAQDSAMAAFEASLTETQRDALARLIDSQEVPASVLHLFSTGFPKSLAIGKSIHKHLGIEREVIGQRVYADGTKGHSTNKMHEGYQRPCYDNPDNLVKYDTQSSPELQQYEQLGSALKPACENWWLCRKPLSEKTLAANCLKWGTGGLNIDKSRVGVAEDDPNWRDNATPRNGDRNNSEIFKGFGEAKIQNLSSQGRFPSNVLFSHSLFCTDTVCDASCPVRVLEQQSGVRKSGGVGRGIDTASSWFGKGSHTLENSHASTGTASRFFHCFTPDVPFLYCAKSSRSERSKGCEGIEPTQMMRISSGPDKTLRRCTEHNASLPSGSNYYSCGCAKQYGDNPVEGGEEGRIHAIQNTHPTVKPQNLLRYLISMITPDHGIVLDMFFGSGSTGVAAIAEGYHFIGIEQSDTPDEPYCTIARARIAHALRGVT